MALAEWAPMSQNVTVSDAEKWKMAFRVALDIMTPEQREAWARLWLAEFETELPEP